MPPEIERVFSDAELSLFPESLNEISSSCSCPDWSNPCKHVAAVYYLLGEAFDGDPFLIVRLRGIDRDHDGPQPSKIALSLQLESSLEIAHSFICGLPFPVLYGGVLCRIVLKSTGPGRPGTFCLKHSGVRI